MRKNRVIEQNRCYHLVSRLAHRAFFLDNWTELTLDEKALMWKIWPRATALSKVLSDRKKGDCDYEGE